MIVPKVTVITPAYNAEKYLSQAIESILKQTFTDFEYIIIDDGSIDNTWQIINSYAKQDPRIVSLQNKQNKDIPYTRNKGVKMAKGKYIVWQDADDISLPYRIEKQYNFMEKNTAVGIVGGYLQFFKDDRLLGIRKYQQFDKYLRKSIFRYSPVAQPAAMIRKKCICETGFYDLECRGTEDLDMSFKIGQNYKFANLPQVIIKYRESDTSVTHTRLKKMELSTLKIRKKYIKGFGYNFTFQDRIYNLLQYITTFIIPAKIKIWIFKKFRDSK